MNSLNNFIKKLEEKDLYLDGERALLDFTESCCELHGQFTGIYWIYYHLFEWLGEKLLWRKGTDAGKPGEE